MKRSLKDESVGCCRYHSFPDISLSKICGLSVCRPQYAFKEGGGAAKRLLRTGVGIGGSAVAGAFAVGGDGNYHGLLWFGGSGLFSLLRGFVAGLDALLLAVADEPAQELGLIDSDHDVVDRLVNRRIR